MNKQLIPFVPLINFFNRSIHSGSLSFSLIHNFSPWLLKLLLFEPLRCIENALYHQQIEKHHLPKHPVFILGHWRSGTTYLQNLLRQDQQFGHFNLYGSVLPEITLLTERTLKPVLQMFADLVRARNKYHRIHFNFDFPGEEDVALTALSIPTAPHWGHLFPLQYEKYADKYLFLQGLSQKELNAFLYYYDYLIKKISIQNKGRQLILKSPPNTARIKHLIKLYPEAKFIYIHRNPLDVFYSNMAFWDTTERFGFQKLNKEVKQEYIYSTYTKLLTSYLTERSLIPQGNIVEVRYEELVADPLLMVESIYRKLDLQMNDSSNQHMKAFINENKSYATKKYVYGKDIVEEVKKHWDFSLSEWNYPINTI